MKLACLSIIVLTCSCLSAVDVKIQNINSVYDSRIAEIRTNLRRDIVKFNAEADAKIARGPVVPQDTWGMYVANCKTIEQRKALPYPCASFLDQVIEYLNEAYPMASFASTFASMFGEAERTSSLLKLEGALAASHNSVIEEIRMNAIEAAKITAKKEIDDLNSARAQEIKTVTSN